MATKKIERQQSDERVDKTPAEAVKLADDDERARIAQILEMGLVTDMIAVKDKDPNKRYVWVRERDTDISKFSLLGYELEAVGEDEKVHGAGDNRKRVGDVVLMSIPRARYDLIQSVREERRKKRQRSPIKEYKRRAAQAAAKGEAAPPLDLAPQEE